MKKIGRVRKENRRIMLLVPLLGGVRGGFYAPEKLISFDILSNLFDERLIFIDK
jgi:hypothetical protein